jgi:hypothetical protein
VRTGASHVGVVRGQADDALATVGCWIELHEESRVVQNAGVLHLVNVKKIEERRALNLCRCGGSRTRARVDGSIDPPDRPHQVGDLQAVGVGRLGQTLPKDDVDGTIVGEISRWNLIDLRARHRGPNRKRRGYEASDDSQRPCTILVTHRPSNPQQRHPVIPPVQPAGFSAVQRLLSTARRYQDLCRLSPPREHTRPQQTMADPFATYAAEVKSKQGLRSQNDAR